MSDGRVREINVDEASTTIGDALVIGKRRIRPAYANYFGSHVRQKHSCERARPDTREFNDPNAREGTTH